MRPEIECRRPEFTEGCKVVLGDGQEWTFPKPVLRLLPVRNESGGFELKKAPPYGPDYEADLLKFIDAAQGDDVTFYDFLCLRVTLAATLLSRNYDLSDEEIQGLLYVVNEESEEAAAMWADVEAVLMGQSPKPSAVGSDAP